LEEKILEISAANDPDSCFQFHQPAQEGGIGRSDKAVHRRGGSNDHAEPTAIASSFVILRPAGVAFMSSRCQES
jgi:hypothetical protein